MANYYSPTIVQPKIPLIDITPLEKLILSQIFCAEEDQGELYLYSDEGPLSLLFLSTAELRGAFAASAAIESRIASFIEARIKEAPGDSATIEVDCSDGELSYPFILQDILRRSKTVPYITVVASYSCSRMRPDGFGGSATLVTPTVIDGSSTYQILEELILKHIGAEEAP